MAAFCVTWKIENFSMCAHKVGEDLLSPEFSLPEFNNITWIIQLYPRGSNDESVNYVSVFLRRIDEDVNAKIEKFLVSFRCVHSDLKQSEKNENNTIKLKVNADCGFSKLIPRGRLYKNDGFLPQDILTVQVVITPLLDSEVVPTNPAIDELILSKKTNPNFNAEECYSIDSETKNPSVTQCSFLTRIPVEKRVVNWSIRELGAKRKSKEKMSLMLEPEFYEGAKLLLVCYCESYSEKDECLKIKITRKGMDVEKIFVQCEVSFLDGENAERNSKESEHVFGGTYDPWSFTLIDKFNTSKYLINNDSLRMIICFSISYESQNFKFFPSSSGKCDLRKKVRKMLDHEETTNFSFECKNGKIFPIHQLLICASSPVFRAMFSSDTLEKQTRVVRMQDTDTDTVRLLRNYLYSDSLPDLEAEDVIKLYSVADTYLIEKLKDLCSAYLKNNISVDNVYDVLIVADLHHDVGLKDYLIDFLCAEMDFNSDEWEKFTEENLKLAAETMKNCLVRKFAKLDRKCKH